MKNHTVTSYVNHTTREFSVSRREDNNHHHAEIAALEKSKGFDINVHVKNCEESAAEGMKAGLIAHYKECGYTQVIRESIPDATERLGMRPTEAAAKGII